ncbi:MAG: family 78 glycoside hydrolase catalytic domain [Cyclobacteriaceae bacterium]
MRQSIFFLALFFLIMRESHSGDIIPVLKINELRVEYQENPSAIDVASPRFSWVLTGEGRGRYQTSYQIEVASSKENLEAGRADIWNSGQVVSSQTNQVEYEGPSLESFKKYHWRVKVWDENQQQSGWSPPSFWSMGALKFSDWKGKFISHNVGYNKADKYDSLYLPPARYLRKSFNINKKVKRAVAYTTALGLYELRLNGSKVGKYHFLPGWTDYDKRLYYQAFDITASLQSGENVVGAVIADGWYSGYIGYALLVRLDKVRGFYGENPAFMGQIVVEYEDGSTEIIASNETWRASEGAIREADILMGETVDGRLGKPGWDRPGYDDEDWKKPKIYTYPNGRLQAYPGDLIEVRENIKPKSITKTESGSYIFDLGKNIAGIVRLNVQGPRGTKVTLRYGEMMKDDGSLLTENLRLARATDTYILHGDGKEIWEPKFTYHGFQYVEVTGYPGTPDLNSLEGLVLSSINTTAGSFSTSNEMNNTLFDNILTTQSANFFEVPTDCPQRDERLGWTGDAQTFCRSATYNADVAAFFTKFLIDLDDAQRWYGAYPNFAPFPYSRPDQYSPAWMDAGVIIPYNMYKVYGDTRIVDYMYSGMQKFMQFQSDASTNYLRPGGGNNWGDWLSVNEKTSDNFVASSFYGYDAYLMAEMAEALGKKEDAEKYRDLFQNIKKSFAGKYILSDGRTTEDTQTSYALALYFKLYPENLAAKGAERLAQKIQDNGNKFSSGFLGTKHVMLSLAEYGYHDICYKLFKQTEYPSWGYSVENGSTSIWERWNSYTKDADQNSNLNAAMNSFSHYAFGSVAEWMYIYAAGIETDGSGFKNIRIQPAVSKEMDRISAGYKSIAGEIKSAWAWNGNKLELSVTIPVNTTARIVLPVESASNVKMDNKSIGKIPGIESVENPGDKVILEVGSGDYNFSTLSKYVVF